MFLQLLISSNNQFKAIFIFFNVTAFLTMMSSVPERIITQIFCALVDTRHFWISNAIYNFTSSQTKNKRTDTNFSDNSIEAGILLIVWEQSKGIFFFICKLES